MAGGAFRNMAKMAKMAKIGKPRYRFLYNHLPDGLQKLDSHRILPHPGSLQTDFFRRNNCSFPVGSTKTEIS